MDNMVEVSPNHEASVGGVRLMESIERGQTVKSWVLSAVSKGQTQEIARGTTIGHTRLERFSPRLVSTVRLDWQTLDGGYKSVSLELLP
jgi:hypothetical protein